MNDLDARARAERLAAALGLTVRTSGSDRHGHSVSFHRGAERVDGCVSPNTVDAWLEAERKLRALARAELPDAAASAAGSARYGAGLRADAALDHPRDVDVAAQRREQHWRGAVARLGGAAGFRDDEDERFGELAAEGAEDVVDAVGIAVGVDDGDDRDLELPGLLDRNRLLVGVDDEQQVRQAAHVLDAAERAVELVALALDVEQLFLGAAGLVA